VADVTAQVVPRQMIASVVHSPHFLRRPLKFLFCALKFFAKLDESSDHPLCSLPLTRPVTFVSFTARLCILFGLSFAATHNKFARPHLRLRPLLLAGRQDGFVHDW
jgi:hypothetical protein